MDFLSSPLLGNGIAFASFVAAVIPVVLVFLKKRTSLRSAMPLRKRTVGGCLRSVFFIFMAVFLGLYAVFLFPVLWTNSPFVDTVVAVVLVLFSAFVIVIAVTSFFVGVEVQDTNS